MPRLKNFKAQDPGPLLPFPHNIGDDDISGIVRAALHKTIRCSKSSAAQIAQAMTGRLGVNVTEHMLRDFCAESHPHRFPFEFAPAFIKATGDTSLLNVLCASLGVPTPAPEHADMVGFAKARIAADLHGQEADGYKSRILRGGLR